MLRGALFLALAALAAAQPPQPAFEGKAGDYISHDFKFHDGSTLPELRVHYTTLGTPKRNAAGHVDNAVIIMHGTGGTGRPFLGASFGGELFRKGHPLDAEQYFIILPDAVGHGGSSKPSDGLHAKFPHYNYE